MVKKPQNKGKNPCNRIKHISYHPIFSSQVSSLIPNEPVKDFLEYYGQLSSAYLLRCLPRPDHPAPDTNVHDLKSLICRLLRKSIMPIFTNMSCCHQTFLTIHHLIQIYILHFILRHLSFQFDISSTICQLIL